MDPAGSDAGCVAKKKNVTAFLNCLAFTVDHNILIHCHIYRFRDVCIEAGESPDEMVTCFCDSTTQYQYLSDDKLECIAQHHPIHIHNCELGKMLLQLAPENNLEDILEVCHMYITHDTNFSVIGLGTCKTVNAMQCQSK